MKAFRKSGRSFTKSPTEAEAAWFKKASQILAKHNITKNESVPKNIALPPYPKGQSCTSFSPNGVTRAAPKIDINNFEKLISECDQMLDETSHDLTEPVLPQTQRLAKRAAKAQLAGESDKGLGASTLQYKHLSLNPPAQCIPYDSNVSFHANMNACWELEPDVSLRSHKITFVPPKSAISAFKGQSRQAVYERHTVDKSQFATLIKYFNLGTAKATASNSMITMLDGSMQNLDTSLLVHDDEDLASMALQLLTTAYAQHHFEELTGTMER